MCWPLRLHSVSPCRTRTIGISLTPRFVETRQPRRQRRRRPRPRSSPAPPVRRAPHRADAPARGVRAAGGGAHHRSPRLAARRRCCTRSTRLVMTRSLPLTRPTAHRTLPDSLTRAPRRAGLVSRPSSNVTKRPADPPSASSTSCAAAAPRRARRRARRATPAGCSFAGRARARRTRAPPDAPVSSNSSPARAAPPPITTSSGSKVLIALAMPIPTRSAQISTIRWPPPGRRARAASTASAPSTGFPSSQPLTERRGRVGRRRLSGKAIERVAGGRILERSRLRKPSPSVPARARSQSKVQPDDRVAELAGAAGRAAVDPAAEHDPAPDPGADRDHHQVLGDQPQLRVVRLGERRHRRVVVDEHRARRGARPAPGAAARRSAGC